MNRENQNETNYVRGLSLSEFSGTEVKPKNSYVPAQIRIGDFELENAFLSVSAVEVNSVSVMEFEDGFGDLPESGYDVYFD